MNNETEPTLGQHIELYRERMRDLFFIQRAYLLKKRNLEYDTLSDNGVAEILGILPEHPYIFEITCLNANFDEWFLLHPKDDSYNGYDCDIDLAERKVLDAEIDLELAPDNEVPDAEINLEKAKCVLLDAQAMTKTIAH